MGGEGWHWVFLLSYLRTQSLNLNVNYDGQFIDLAIGLGVLGSLKIAEMSIIVFRLSDFLLNESFKG